MQNAVFRKRDDCVEKQSTLVGLSLIVASDADSEHIDSMRIV
jgi:hypothetical protein